MTLTPDNVYHYLRKRQLIDEAEVVKGNYQVIPVKTRNNIMKIQVSRGRSLFVKELDKDRTSGFLFRRETAAYRLFSQTAATSPIASFTPELLDADDEEHIMVTRLVEGRSMHEYYMATRNFDPALAKEQAALLTAYHRAPVEEAGKNIFPKLLPWVLQLDRHQAHEFFTNNASSAKVISIIKTNKLLQDNLLQLAGSWKHTHLVHGDIKWINFLLTDDAEGATQKLIDWELADLGDPLWDVAGLVQSHIATWLFGFDNNAPRNVSLPQNMEPYNLHHLQPSAKALLLEYMELNKITGTARTAFLVRVMQLTAARILQTCIEGVNYSQKVEANNMRGVQLAHNIFKDPAYTLYELLDIRI